MLKEPDILYDLVISRSMVNKYKKYGFYANIGDTIQVTAAVLIDAGSVMKLNCVCDACGKEFKRQARQIKERLAKDQYCTSCGIQSTSLKNKDHIGIPKQQIKDTLELEKYGTLGLSREEKNIRTCMNRYGVPNVFYLEETKEKSKLTCMERYGVHNPMQSREVIEQREQNFLEQYGVTNLSKLPVVIQKIKDTKEERYGNPNYTNSEKRKQTNLERYGVPHTNYVLEIQDRRIASLKEYCQSQEFFDRRKELREEKGWGEFRDDRSDWDKYRFEVWCYTNQNNLALLENYDKRGLAGVEGSYQLDHKISVKYGFDNNIPPHIIGNINNIEMVPWFDNLSKGPRCTLSIEELLELINNTKD